MRRRDGLRVALAALMAVVVGCPAEEPATPPMAPPRPGPSPVAQGEPAPTPAPPPIPADGRQGSNDDAPTAPARAGHEAAPVRVTIERPPAPTIGEAVRLRPGQLLELSRELRVGHAGTSGPVAHLEVLVGPYCYAVDAGVAGRVVAGPAGLVLDAVEEGVVGLSWTRSPASEPSTWDLVQAPRVVTRDGEERLLVREMALFSLPDGVRVGVGDVGPDPTLGAGAPPSVTITVFSPTYAADPGQGYGRDLRAREGQVVGPAAGPRFEVERVTPASSGGWGTVTLVRR